MIYTLIIHTHKHKGKVRKIVVLTCHIFNLIFFKFNILFMYLLDCFLVKYGLSMDRFCEIDPWFEPLVCLFMYVCMHLCMYVHT